MTKPDGNRLRARMCIALACAAGVGVLVTVAMLLRADSTPSEGTSDRGVTHIHDTQASVPWSIHIVKIDRSRKELTFAAPLARNKILGVSRISEQARSIPPEIGEAVAAVNGDFYERDNPTYAGDPRGLQIVNSELVSAPSTTSVWFDSGGNPHLDDVRSEFMITWPNGRKTPFELNRQRLPNMAVLYTPTYGASTRVSGGRDLILEKEGTGPWLPIQAGQTYRARIREVRAGTNTVIEANTMLLSLGPQFLLTNPLEAAGAILEISTATTPDVKNAKVAISGGPTLIKDGKAFSAKAPPPGTRGGYSEGSKYERHPRSAIGWNATHIYFVTVDGRQPGLSVGMTISELADYLVKLGCTDGMNFDGGASASLWMSGRIINNPCQGERPIANSLVVVRKNGLN